MVTTPTSRNTGTVQNNDPLSLLTQNQMWGQNSRAMEEIINIIRESTSIPDFMGKTPRIVLMILINHYNNNTEKFVELLKAIAWRTASAGIYTRKVFSRRDVRSQARYTADSFAKLPEVSYSYGIPMYVTPTDTSVTVEYISCFHRNTIRECLEEGSREFNTTEGSSKYYLYSNNSYRSHKPRALFPSLNYQKIMDLITNRIAIESSTKAYQVLGILIDGVPGLGKSNLADFAASSGNVDEVYRVDLSNSQFLQFKPAELFSKIYGSISIVNGPTMFVIDEMDKWLKFYINNSYDKLRSGGSSGGTASAGAAAASTPVSNGYIPSLEEHTQNVKQEFLLCLLELLERDNISNSCIIVFCCNNFETIFEGVEITHYESLLDRFMPIHFEQCDRDELIRFFSYYNQLFQLNSQSLKFYNSDCENILMNIRSDVLITFRKLAMVSTKESFNYQRIVNILNHEYRTPPSTPKGSPSGSPNGSPIGSPERLIACSSGLTEKGKGKKKLIQN